MFLQVKPRRLLSIKYKLNQTYGVIEHNKATLKMTASIQPIEYLKKYTNQSTQIWQIQTY